MFSTLRDISTYTFSNRLVMILSVSALNYPALAVTGLFIYHV